MVGIDYMVVADAATTAENKQYIHGAGWDTIATLHFPIVQPQITAAVLIRVPWNDANIPFHLTLDLVNADGASALPNPPGPLGGDVTVGRPPQVAPGNDLLFPLVFQLVNVLFAVAGDYVLVLSVDGDVKKRFPIHVVQVAQPRQ